MHTAICTFEDRALAEEAVERLVRAGFDRHSVHLEARHPDGSPMEEPRAPDVAGKFSFFERLIGAEDDAATYKSALERGLYVVLVEHPDPAEAERAQEVLHGMEAGDMNIVHQARQPLREALAEPEPERALASQGWGEQRELKVVEGDKPIASPDIPAAHEDKPR